MRCRARWMGILAGLLAWGSSLIGGAVSGAPGPVAAPETSRVGGAGEQLALDAAIALALEQNEALLMAQSDTVRAAGAVREATAGALPQLTLEAAYQRNFEKPAFYAPEEFGGGKVELGSDIEVQGNLRLDQVLYAFGRVGNAVRYAKLYRGIAALNVARARSEVVFSVREAYYRVLLAERLVDIRRQALVQAQSHLVVVAEKLEQGTASRFDRQRAEVEVRNREPELIRAENDLSLARQELARRIGLQLDAAFVLTDSLTHVPRRVDLDAAIRASLTQRPELLGLERQVDGLQRLLAIRRAERLPMLGLYGQLGIQGASDADHPFDPLRDENRAISTAIGVSFRVPIFDGLRTRGRVEQARAAVDRGRHELRQARKSVRLEVTQAVQELRSIQQEYEAQLATVALAAETYAIAETRFRNGLSTRLELTDAETALDAARTHSAETLYRYNVALANLERALGTEWPAAPTERSEDR